MSITDSAAFFERLRISTAKLLKLDPTALSAADATRVSRASILRVSLDRMESTALAGGDVDLKAFIAASAELERLLGGEPDKPTNILASGEGQAKLRALIERAVLSGSAEDAERDADLMWREEQAAIIAAGVDDLAAAALPAADGDASDSGEQHPPPSRAPADAASSAPPPLTPAERQARVDALNSQPANPPDQRCEPWRSHVNADGIIAPWFNPHG
jgi:hypothetical protein